MADLTLPTPNKTPGDGTPASDTNLIIEAVNTLNSAVENIAAGPQGPQGEPGTPGAAGANASVTVGNTNTGAPGSDAAVTNSGTAQAAVFDFTIPRGETGNTGATGSTGAQGPTGAAGSDAVVSVGTVATGAPGSLTTITNSGSPSSAVFDFSIPRGDVGATGAQGAKGDTGDAATIAVGTVTTGDPGTSAVITNAGTSGAAVFDFAIPRGDVGPTGPPVNLSSSTPQNLGTAAVGTATDAARGDHVHNMPSATDVGADPAGSASTVAGDLTTHEGLTTSVHGISDTSNLVYTSDARLSDSRTPTAHKVSHSTGGTDALVASDIGAAPATGISPSAITGTAVVTADSRLSDTRTPTDGSVTDTKIVAGGLSTTAITGTAVVTADARLSDARTPTAHKASHSTGGTDALVASDIGALATTGGTVTGPTVVDVNSSSAALLVTQTGSGDALLIEDSANPDSTPFVVTTNGNVGIGTSSVSQKLVVNGGNINLTRSAAHSNVFFSRENADSTIVENGNALGDIVFRGYDGTTDRVASRIRGQVDGIPGSSDMPGALGFWTTADGGTAETERMRITSAGNVGIGTNSPAYKLDVNGTVNATAVLVNGSPLSGETDFSPSFFLGGM
jgi:hypothetical protein